MHESVFHATRLALIEARDMPFKHPDLDIDEGLLCDAFVSLFDRTPQLRHQVPLHLALRREMFRVACSTQLYADLNSRTAHRYELASSLTPLWAGEVAQAEKQARAAAEEAERRARRLQELQDDGAPDAEIERAREAVQRAWKEERKARIRARRQLIRRLATMRDAVQLTEDLAAMGWGSGAGIFVRLVMEDRVRAETIQAVRKVAGWFGRLRELWTVAKARVPRRGPRISGTTRGDDLLRMLPQEHLRLSDPELAWLWALDFARRRLLQYRRTGAQHHAGHGPVIVLVDESGSMSGEPVMYAKAFAFLLRAQAKAEGRACHLISFSSYPRDLHELPDNATAAEAAEWAARFIGGGTDWVPPLERACQLLRDTQYRRADLVMLTDGICRIPPDRAESIRGTLASHEARLFCFLFGSGNPQPLRPLATGIWKVTLDEQGILQVLEAFEAARGGGP